MRTLFYSASCFVLLSVISLSAQAGVFPKHSPCLPNSAEVSPVSCNPAYNPVLFNRRIPRYHTGVQEWVAGPSVSLIQQDSLAGWTSVSGKEPGAAWSVQNGVLHLQGKGGDLVSNREYENFILEFSWTISKGGNSGIKYRLKKYDGKGWLGLEYQVLDDFNTAEGNKTKNNTATLYDILSTDVSSKHLNPNDQLNYGKVVVCGQHITHYLNGEKVLEITPGSEQWYEAVAQSKFSDVNSFGLNPAGLILVQDHNCEVWYHSITIRELYPAAGFSANLPARRGSSPYFSESRDTFPAPQVCGNLSGNFPNINVNPNFGQFLPPCVKKTVCPNPCVKRYYVPMSVPKHRCGVSNIFNR
jgi:hypothetical protein